MGEEEDLEEKVIQTDGLEGLNTVVLIPLVD